jgi:hypothetical protein
MSFLSRIMLLKSKAHFSAGGNNRVRGDILTQEVALRSFSTAVVEEFEAHQDDLVEEVEAARAETIDEALAAGPAF